MSAGSKVVPPRAAFSRGNDPFLKVGQDFSFTFDKVHYLNARSYNAFTDVSRNHWAYSRLMRGREVKALLNTFGFLSAKKIGTDQTPTGHLRFPVCLRSMTFRRPK